LDRLVYFRPGAGLGGEARSAGRVRVVAVSAESFAGTSISRAPARALWGLTAALILLSSIGLWAAHLQLAALTGLAGVALAAVVYAAIRVPQAAVAFVALSAILDRYIVGAQLPTQLGVAAHFTSEIFLAAVGVTLTLRAWRARELLNAFRHPATVFLAGFVILAVVSAMVNLVRPVPAAAGLLFTLDAVALFYLARMAHIDLHVARTALTGFVVFVTGAAVIAIIQAVLRPDVFGLTALVGRFGETYRLASIFGDPNVFAALISASAPFAIMTATRGPQPRDRWIGFAISLVLATALWLSFSRGGWLGMIVGFGAATLVLDRRAFLVGATVLLVGFAVANVLPRELAVPRQTAVGASDPTAVVRPTTTATASRGSVPKPSGVLASTVDRLSTVASGRDLRTLFVLNAVVILADHPFLGVGPGQYGGAASDMFGTPIYRQYGTDSLFHGSQRTVDNFWLHLTVESGVLGITAFLVMIVFILLPICRAARRSTSWRLVVLVGIAAAASALIVNSLTTMLLESNSVAFVFWLLLGVGSVVAGTPERPREDEAATSSSVP